MDTKFQTSFIPKKPLVPNGGRIQSTHHLSFFSIIVTLILLVAIAGAGVVFGMERYYTSQIAKMAIKLEAAEESLNQAEIGEWVRLDRRIEAGKELLGNHLAVSSFFDLLEQMTLKSIQFKNFSYSITSGQKVAVTMDGQADSFAALALQSDEFAKQSKQMSNQLFSSIDQDKLTGRISFKFSALIDPSLISYKKVVEGEPEDGDDTQEIVLPKEETDGGTPARTLPVAPAPKTTN